MHAERITKEDGRYLVFYTFEDAGEDDAADSGKSRAADDAGPQADAAPARDRA